jgi:NAD(P)-dependent dehydrogenase (short-subunit alcohol dehydrogenase family)
MSDFSSVIIGGDRGLGAGIGTGLGVPFLPLAADRISTDSGAVVAAQHLVWIHPVPALRPAQGADGSETVFAEAATLLASGQVARAVAERSRAKLVFIAALPARGLMTGEHGAACDMAIGAMESIMRVQIGPWSNAGHRLLAIVYTGIDGYSETYMRSEDEVRKRTPMHELCTFGQLADAIRFVGSQRAAYISGTVLRVDGGWNAYSWMYPARTI